MTENLEKKETRSLLRQTKALANAGAFLIFLIPEILGIFLRLPFGLVRNMTVGKLEIFALGIAAKSPE